MRLNFVTHDSRGADDQRKDHAKAQWHIGNRNPYAGHGAVSGTLIVIRDRPDLRRKVHLPWKEDYFRHRISAIRAAAGIDFSVKFMGLRHGGNTEGGDADLTDTQIRALSGHKTAAMTALYTKATMRQRQVGARKRLEARTKEGNLSK